MRQLIDNETIKTWLNKSKNYIVQQNPIVVMGLGSIVIITLSLLWIFASPSHSNDNALLFGNLNAKSIAKYAEILQKSHISFSLSPDGTKLYVPKSERDNLRLKLIQNHFMDKHQKGLELFDKNDFGLTDFSNKIHFLRAQQGELERTLSQIEAINFARVHLVIPEHILFSEQQKPPHAAISLNTNHSLSSEQITSIQELVAASIDDLAIKNITIVDQYGQLLTRHINHQKIEDRHTQIERNYQQKLESLLTPIFGKNNFSAKINITLNHESKKITQEIPFKHEVINETHQKKTHISTKTKKPITTETQKSNYALGKQKTWIKETPGSIKHIHIAIVVPQNTEESTIQKINNLVIAAFGLHINASDTLNISALAYPQPTITKHYPEIHQNTYSAPSRGLSAGTTHLSPSIKISLSCLLLIMFFLLYRFKDIKIFRNRQQNHMDIHDKDHWIQTLKNYPPSYIANVLRQEKPSWLDDFLQQFDEQHLIKTHMENAEITPLALKRIHQDFFERVMGDMSLHTLARNAHHG